jgi:transposase
VEVLIVFSTATRYDVLRAREAGLDAARIERLTGVPARSQRRIAMERVPFGMTDSQLHAVRRVGRPSGLTPELQQEIHTLLAGDPVMRGAELLRRLRTFHGYGGGKSAVYDHLRESRPPRPAPPPIVRFEGVAGEFAQHDFGEVRVQYRDQTSEKLRFYAGRLKYSRALHVRLADGETAEAYIRGMEAAAVAWGGLALLNVVDNSKAVVLRRQKDPETGAERIRYQEQFASFLQEANVFAEPTAPYSGNQKGSVESLVKFVKGSFFAARSFRNRRDLEQQLGEWLTEVNEVRPCDATKIIPRVRLAEEGPWLRPLACGPRGYGLRYSAVVSREARVRWGGYQYSTPAGWIGQTLTVRVHPEQVVLHYHQGELVHPRVPANGKYSLLPEHRSALFHKPRGKVMAQRQILMDLCPEGEQFFTALVHRRPQTWRQQDLPEAWALFEELGDERMRAGLRYCVAQAAIGAEYLRAWAQGIAS